MTPLERAARALCELAGHNPDGPTCDIYVPGDPVAHLPWAGYRREALAVMEAIREPSQDMVFEGSLAGEFDVPDGRYSSADEAKKVWQAMVDAALVER